MNEREIFIHYIGLLQQRADQLKPVSSGENDFEQGVSFAYHEVLDLLVESLRVFNLKFEQLGLSKPNPDRLL